MRGIRLSAVLMGALLALAALPASAEEGDPPSGPEACLVDRYNQRRSAGDFSWSGALSEPLRRHARQMAAAGGLSHDEMEDRLGALPAGWSGYGETASVEVLDDPDGEGVAAWCAAAVEALWASDGHRRVLTDGAFGFVTVGTHWDGDRIWIVTGVFAHPSYRPASVPWPSDYAVGLRNWDGRFADDDGSTFEADIEALAAAGVTMGCDPPDNTRFCPEDPVTRGEMAAFLVRALQVERAGPASRFVDDDGSVFEADIEALTAAGMAHGCDPPSFDRFCPERAVTRAEMATFLVRALALPPAAPGLFADVSASVHQEDIDSLYAAGITEGCAPGLYCPDRAVTRAEMAAFLARAGLTG